MICSQNLQKQIQQKYQRGRAWCAAPDPPLQDVIGTM